MVLLLSCLLLSLSFVGHSSVGRSNTSNLTPSQPQTFTRPTLRDEDRRAIWGATASASGACDRRILELFQKQNINRLTKNPNIPPEDKYFLVQAGYTFAHMDREMRSKAPQVPGQPVRPSRKVRGRWELYDSRHLSWYYEHSAKLFARNYSEIGKDLIEMPQLQPEQLTGRDLRPSQRGVIANQSRRVHRLQQVRTKIRAKRCQVLHIDSIRQLQRIWNAEGVPGLYPGAVHPVPLAEDPSSTVQPEYVQDPRSIESLLCQIEGPSPAPSRKKGVPAGVSSKETSSASSSKKGSLPKEPLPKEPLPEGSGSTSKGSSSASSKKNKKGRK